MAKIRVEDILKPGETIIARKIPDDEVDAMVKKSREQQDFILSLKEVSQEDLNARMTI